MSNDIKLYCPNCGHKFKHHPNFKGKVIGSSSGAISGAIFGAKIGIAAGPLGAIAGTVPGSILSMIFGKNFGNKFDRPKCPSCKINFEIPYNLKQSFLNNLLKKDKDNKLSKTRRDEIIKKINSIEEDEELPLGFPNYGKKNKK